MSNEMPAPPFPPENCRDETCAHHELHDPETEEPIGAACGGAVTQVIFWKDRRYSPSCEQHGLDALDEDARARVVCIHPIKPARGGADGEG